MRNESRDNTEVIKELFSVRWDRAEAMFRNQACENNLSRPREPQATGGVVTFTVDGTGLTRDDTHGRSILFK